MTEKTNEETYSEKLGKGKIIGIIGFVLGIFFGLLGNLVFSIELIRYGTALLVIGCGMFIAFNYAKRDFDKNFF